MSTIPKHEARRKTAKNPPLPAVVDHSTATDLSGVEVELSHIAHSLKSYNVNACDGNFRLVLEGDALDRIADSLKRIADAMTAGAKG